MLASKKVVSSNTDKFQLSPQHVNSNSFSVFSFAHRSCYLGGREGFHIEGKESSYEIFTAYDSVALYPDGYPDHPHRKYILCGLRPKVKSRWYECELGVRRRLRPLHHYPLERYHPGQLVYAPDDSR